MIYPEQDAGTPRSLIGSFTNARLDDRRQSISMRNIQLDQVITKLDAISTTLEKIMKNQKKSIWQKILQCFCIRN